jgi:TonB family protein
MKSLVLWLMQTNRMRRPQSIDELTHKLSTLWSKSFKSRNGYKDQEETVVASPRVDISEETVIEKSSFQPDNNKVETKETLVEVNIDDIDLTDNEGLASIVKYLLGAAGIFFVIWFVFLAYQDSRTEQQISPVDDFIGNDTISLDSVIVEEEKVFDEVEHMPEFPGGPSVLFEWISKNINYPPSAKMDGVEGRVIVTFIVERDGTLTNVRVFKSVHPSLDKEATRVVKSMPRWIPGKQNGSAVRTKYTVPVTFRKSLLSK